MKTYNTEFDEIIITLTNQNGRSLEMGRCSIEPRTKKDIKREGFLTFVRNIAKKYGKQLLDKGLDALKTVSKKTVHKAAETTGEFIGNKMADKILKQKLVIDKNSRNIEKIIIPPEKKRRRSIKCVKTSIIKVG